MSQNRVSLFSKQENDKLQFVIHETVYHWHHFDKLLTNQQIFVRDALSVYLVLLLIISHNESYFAKQYNTLDRTASQVHLVYTAGIRILKVLNANVGFNQSFKYWDTASPGEWNVLMLASTLNNIQFALYVLTHFRDIFSLF